ncbi:MAG: glycerophosphodiester phosphodiesterase family protein [Micrococcales bacterium]
MFLSPATMPRILAHRGQPEGENTIPAFQSALKAGADIIETDLQCTSDGVAVVFHDDDLKRVLGVNQKVSEITLPNLQRLMPAISSLEQVLIALPNAKFNIDFKTERAIEPGVAVIRKLNAESRVLVTSFSESRVRRLRKLAPELAKSLSGVRVFFAWMLPFAIKFLTKGFSAAQIPVSFGPLPLATSPFIRALKACGLEVHFWVVNEIADVEKLLALGADGFVTDNTAELVSHLRKA